MLTVALAAGAVGGVLVLYINETARQTTSLLQVTELNKPEKIKNTEIANNTPQPICGNGVCETGETSASCPRDCVDCTAACQEQGYQENTSDCSSPNVGEKFDNCCCTNKSSTNTCGNGKCETGETAAGCSQDCGGAGTVCIADCGSTETACVNKQQPLFAAGEQCCPGTAKIVAETDGNPVNGAVIKYACVNNPSGCAGENEMLSGSKQCCLGLAVRTITKSTPYANSTSYECVKPVCGDGACEGGERSTCPQDCCIKEGQSGLGSSFCCKGLAFSAGGAPDANGNCPSPADTRMMITPGGGGTCIACGNGVCGLGENKCNCPQDCNKK